VTLSRHARIAHETQYTSVLSETLAINHTADGLFKVDHNSVDTWWGKFVLAAIVTPRDQIKKYLIVPHISIHFEVVFYNFIKFVFR
jgi:hypothetical protein